MDFLTSIAQDRRERVLRDERRVSTVELRDRAEVRGSDVRPFAEALRRAPGEPLRVIAEVKQASPSAGVLRPAYDPAGIAVSYEKAGAAAISVLTEPTRFGGLVDHISRVREKVRLPTLLKDFVVHERQLYEARVVGADAALLIVALLPRVQLLDYAALMAEIGLGILVEIHEERELDRALEVSGAMIGVNNRDLRTLELRTGWAERLLPKIPSGWIRVAESGYQKRGELETLERLGVDSVLVGEGLLRSENPGDALRALLSDRGEPGGNFEP